VDASSRRGGEAEVLGDDGQCRLAIAPIRVIDGCEGLMMVVAPLGFSESGIAAEG